MGQVEVLEVLEDSKLPLAVREIAEILGTRIKEVFLIVKKLERHNEIESFELNRLLAMKFFKSKRKMKLYYAP